MSAPAGPATLSGGPLPGAEVSASGDADGRRLRRERNRAAVVDALLALYESGRLRPSSAQIAEQAGLSPRSLFRYFDDVDDLCRAAVARAHAQAASLLDMDVAADAPLAVRVEALVDQRLRLFETMAPAATVMRVESWFQPTLAAELARARSVLREQVRALFAGELATFPPGEAAGVLAAADVLCSFESYQLMRHDQRLAPSQVRSALGRSLARLLQPARGDRRGGRR